MSQQSVHLIGKTHESETKFDYFVCGLAGAIFAYILKDYAPRRIDFGISMLEPMALLFLSFAFFMGLKRIESTKMLNLLNYEFLDASEKAGEMTAALLKAGEGPSFNRETGEVYNPAIIEQKRQNYRLEAQVLEPLITERIRISGRYYTARNCFLYLGFITIFAAKILQPYQTPPLGKSSIVQTNAAKVNLK